jgi:hypothetical protein
MATKLITRSKSFTFMTKDRVSEREIATMRMMRFSGYTLEHIAKMMRRTAPTVWRYTNDVHSDRWVRGRLMTKNTIKFVA